MSALARYSGFYSNGDFGCTETHHCPFLKKAEARIKELEQRLADEVNVSIELNRELILKRLEK